MKDYAPLKRHQALVSFSKEYHFVIAGMENKEGPAQCRRR